jgi:membrane protein required for colicin V production
MEQTMTWIDWLIVIVLAASTIGGLAQGLISSVCSLFGLIFGLAIAAWNYGRIAHILLPVVRIEALANALAFLLIAIVVMAIANLLGTVISKTAKKVGLGCLDSLAGGIFGFFQGVLMVAIGILVIVAFFPEAHWLTKAQMPKKFFGALHWSTDVTPTELANRVRHGLNEMENETPKWMHQPSH